MRIAVIGDLLLDIDLWGPSSRPAPDGGMPIVDVTRRALRAGGAGLVATLLQRDGHEVRLITALGSDSSADRLRELTASLEVVAAPSLAPTPVKTRLRAGDRSVARIDVGCSAAPPPAVTAQQLEALRGADAVVVSDYGRGMTADAGIRHALARVVDEVPTVWDPHPRGSEPVPGVTVATPNRSEATGFAGTDAVRLAAQQLLDAWHPRTLVITLGTDGVLLHGEASRVLPAERVDAPDGCGAGDRFASRLASALAEGRAIEPAVRDAMDATAAFLAAGGVSALT